MEVSKDELCLKDINKTRMTTSISSEAQKICINIRKKINIIADGRTDISNYRVASQLTRITTSINKVLK